MSEKVNIYQIIILRKELTEHKSRFSYGKSPPESASVTILFKYKLKWH